MNIKRTCGGKNVSGQPCMQAPLHESQFCFWHDPDNADQAREARRLGGLRRRREHVVSGTFDFEGLDSISKIRRLLEVAVLDALGLESSLSRARTLGSLAIQAARMLEIGELEDRVTSLEREWKTRGVA